MIEFVILDFDHLTEQEQRNRGSLLPGETFVPKKCKVHNCTSSKEKILKERKKCWIICKKCHVLKTISRESGVIMNTRKKDYVKKYKSVECSNCKFPGWTLPRYMELDHIIPRLGKTPGVTEMVTKSQYSLEDVIAECPKCRVLCGNCHRIHTRNQREIGLFSRSHVKSCVTVTKESVFNKVVPITTDKFNHDISNNTIFDGKCKFIGEDELGPSYEVNFSKFDYTF
jgi:5-methylcytosine-specific restriction endonuclease McrA